jgi:hypothetical protein
MVATGRAREFRLVRGRTSPDGDGVRLDPRCAALLGLSRGDMLRIAPVEASASSGGELLRADPVEAIVQ